MSIITLPPNYKPTEKEEYMNPLMMEYFRQKLENWKAELLNESKDTLDSLNDGGMQEPDIADRATAETDRALEFRTRDRERKLINKIDEALERIKNSDFGYCDETGEPIGIRRLEARAIATMTVEAQERHERMERIQRDEADE
jgi:DnaK suppressor protein